MITNTQKNIQTGRPPHVLITGGAGYIGSRLCGILLNRGYRVTVLDNLLFGGDSILAFLGHPHFGFFKVNVAEEDLTPYFREEDRVDFVIHLAALVGFPACQAVGPDMSNKYNVEAVQRVFRQSENSGVKRFIFASTYSNYGLSSDGKPVTEESPLHPQSLYAETKIAAERYLLEQTAGSACCPLIYRFATLFGISPRTRFDLIVNQFVLEAISKGELIIYQRGFARSFVHISDIAEALVLGLTAPEEKVRRQVYNVGGDEGNYTKEEVVIKVREQLPETRVTYKDLSFGGDMRDIRVSFAKIRNLLGFEPQITLEDGIREVRDALKQGLIANPQESRYRNAQFNVE